MTDRIFFSLIRFGFYSMKALQACTTICNNILLIITFHCNIHHFVMQDRIVLKHWKNDPPKNFEGSVDAA